jgi:hypothetical protein
MGGDAGETATLICLESSPLEQATTPKARAAEINTQRKRFMYVLRSF